MTEKRIKLVASIVHLLIFILGMIAIFMQLITKDKSSNLVIVNGYNIFRFFTNDGNIFISIVSLISFIYLIYSLISKKEYPKWLYLLNLMSAASGGLIFLTVVFVLVPFYGAMLLKGYIMIMLHAINPILSILLFIFYIKGYISKKESILGIIPMAIYGIIALALVISKVWVGNLIPYPFLRVYENPVWMSILYNIYVFRNIWVIYTFSISIKKI